MTQNFNWDYEEIKDGKITKTSPAAYLVDMPFSEQSGRNWTASRMGHWIPKSVIQQSDNKVLIQKWFYTKVLNGTHQAAYITK